MTPIEVKTGASGSMKSLHAFMESKGLKKAYRLDINKLSNLMVDVKTNAGKPVSISGIFTLFTLQSEYSLKIYFISITK